MICALVIVCQSLHSRMLSPLLILLSIPEFRGGLVKVYACACVCTFVFICVHVCAYVYMHAYQKLYVHVNVHMYMHMHMWYMQGLPRSSRRLASGVPQCLLAARLQLDSNPRWSKPILQ